MNDQQWLDRLTRRLDLRRSRIDLLRSYMDGNAPLPEGAEGCREAYRDFQRKARTNFGELVVDAVAERMIVSGFRAGDSATDDDSARQIWKRSAMDVGSGDVIRDMLGVAFGYVMVQLTADGAVMTYECAEQAITERDPLIPHLTRAGLKVYRDEIIGYDVAYLHLPGRVYVYNRDIKSALTSSRADLISGRAASLPDKAEGGWTYVKDYDSGIDVVPLVPFENRKCLGEFETHLDVLDRINWTVLQRLVITALQAYRQRATKGDLPETDENGDTIDYGQMFKPGPGALWQLPEGVDLWESTQAELTGILASSKDDIRDLAAVTRTPMDVLMPDTANQSAQGSENTKEGLIFKADDRIKRAGASFSLAQGIALALEAGDRTPRTDVTTVWLPPARTSLADRADAANKASDLPWRERMARIWQIPEDEIDRMQSERVADALLAASMQPPAVTPPGQQSRPAPNDNAGT